MKKMNKPLLWFILSFIAFHIILLIMWGEHGVYWQLYTGIMLIAAISYVFYQRDLTSKRLLTSIAIGLGTGVVLVLVQVIFTLLTSDITYPSLIKQLSRTGVYFKWQMLVTLLIVMPCHELYIRTILQKQLTSITHKPWIGIIVSALLSSSFFIYLDRWWIVIFIFICQIILGLSYAYTRRIITTSVAQIVAVVILLIFHG
ncbi:CPBP family intramembrane metalloprotease [Staphylococcus felis]|uniref:CPBP family glutamic-type intramembrane protease n=1 Tax=Staphylococcus felis TaxID=46127 RepID=UPI000E246932|nr:CPBP family glutamic-type intramembrane protease [Staphylococcus felis]REH74698.1 CPBP family intramembrane metalloprotease [Staphylococcus felis]REH96489.1 CPBP family intramembrane metalloprotease [Staphylococcus felis]REI03566.1 CPBP family intramembrane metalloprotease [Staphylococcus felis]REI11509.1 CPBP family intramembrane metalloprotease [Staphylococcus felis]REI20163.1 CPBP family intramembrane metalloprotease [Staphylococcus felis]